MDRRNSCTMTDKTTEQESKWLPNPTGKGGFQDHPELINAGGRPKNSQRYDYRLQFFKDMDVTSFKNYRNERKEDDMYVAEAQAYQRVVESLKDINAWKVVADRTEGRAAQAVDYTTNGKDIVIPILGGISKKNS